MPARIAKTLLMPALVIAVTAAATPDAADQSTVQLRPLLVMSGPDATVPFSSPRAIAIDFRHGELFLANTGEHRIEIFSLKGRPRGHFLHRAELESGEIVDGLPIDLAIDSSGNLLVVDRVARYVDVLDYRGRSIARLDPGPQASEPGDGAGSVTVTRDGTILVAARGQRGRVYEFGSDFTPRGSWGVAGTEPGHLSTISGIAASPDGRVVVISGTTDLAVQIFSENGRFIQGFGRHDVGPGNFSLPSGVTVTRDGRIWVVDEIRQVVQVFDSSGSLVGMVGGSGRAPGEFSYPSALASDGDSLLAVTERVGNRFQLFRVQ